MTTLKNLAGKDVPAIGLGCMGMSEFYGPADDGHSLRILKTAFDLGYRHFDTADMYGRGHNEQLLSQFIKYLSPSDRESMVLATKTGIVRDAREKYRLSIDTSKAYIKTSCEASLKRLGVDYIDLYYLHRLSPNTPVEESMDALAELHKEGKIRAAGLCEASADVLRKAHAIFPVSALQSEYSLWTRDVEKEVLPVCDELGIPFVAFSPLGRGFLTGAIKKETIALADDQLDLRKKLPRFANEHIDANLALVERFSALAQQTELSLSVLSLAWLISKSPCVHVIPGTRNDKYLRENFSALKACLDQETVTSLENIFTPGAAAGARYPT